MIVINKNFTFLAAFLLTCFVYSQAFPLPRAAVGDKATVTLTNIDGLVTFVQVDEKNVKVNGQIKKGIDENNPDIYFIDISGVKASFRQLGITISPPGAGPWEATGPGDIDILIGLPFSVLKNENVLDSATITKA